jgi:hypothetical protein
MQLRQKTGAGNNYLWRKVLIKDDKFGREGRLEDGFRACMGIRRRDGFRLTSPMALPNDAFITDGSGPVESVRMKRECEAVDPIRAPSS